MKKLLILTLCTLAIAGCGSKSSTDKNAEAANKIQDSVDTIPVPADPEDASTPTPDSVTLSPVDPADEVPLTPPTQAQVPVQKAPATNTPALPDSAQPAPGKPQQSAQAPGAKRACSADDAVKLQGEVAAMTTELQQAQTAIDSGKAAAQKGDMATTRAELGRALAVMQTSATGCRAYENEVDVATCPVAQVKAVAEAIQTNCTQIEQGRDAIADVLTRLP